MISYAGSFERILAVLNELRENCPWDKKQTLQSLRQLTIEETYELVDAIDAEDWKSLKEELGDLLLHIAFYSRIAHEKAKFDIHDVIESVCNKLVHRHPHIYSNVIVADDDDVKRNWENLKLKEGNKTVLSGVPTSLPSMVKALRLQEKAKQVGFEWEHVDEVKAKIEEEIQELHEAIQVKDHDSIEDEFGDVLFSLINYARFLQIDPDHALERTNKKFIKRFNAMEQKLTRHGEMLSSFSLKEMDAIWNEIKVDENKK